MLGATGAVGQQFVRLLADHPWFELTCVAASERSARRAYGEATRWIGDDRIPEHVARLIVQPCEPRAMDAPVVFSALDSSVAGEVEAEFARAGRTVQRTVIAYDPVATGFGWRAGCRSEGWSAT